MCRGWGLFPGKLMTQAPGLGSEPPPHGKYPRPSTPAAPASSSGRFEQRSFPIPASAGTSTPTHTSAESVAGKHRPRHGEGALLGQTALQVPGVLRGACPWGAGARGPQ